MEPLDSTWIVVDEREGVGRVDTWSEYLCVSRTDEPDTFDIAICRHELVGEIPKNWFDDEGQPLPEYSDDSGHLEVPEYFDGWAGRIKLTGHDGEYLLGELVFDETYGGPISVKADDMAAISGAVNDLGWVVTDESVLTKSVKQAFEAKT